MFVAFQPWQSPRMRAVIQTLRSLLIRVSSSPIDVLKIVKLGEQPMCWTVQFLSCFYSQSESSSSSSSSGSNSLSSSPDDSAYEITLRCRPPRRRTGAGSGSSTTFASCTGTIGDSDRTFFAAGDRADGDIALSDSPRSCQRVDCACLSTNLALIRRQRLNDVIEIHGILFSHLRLLLALSMLLFRFRSINACARPPLRPSGPQAQSKHKVIVVVVITVITDQHVVRDAKKSFFNQASSSAWSEPSSQQASLLRQAPRVPVTLAALLLCCCLGFFTLRLCSRRTPFIFLITVVFDDLLLRHFLLASAPLFFCHPDSSRRSVQILYRSWLFQPCSFPRHLQ